MSSLSERLNIVRGRIAEACSRSGRCVDEITLVVVTKTATLDEIKEAVGLGCLDLGENRVQHLKSVHEEVERYVLDKRTEEGEGVIGRPSWHMIGHLQRNKVKSAIKLVSMIHSVDTLRLGEEINSACSKLDLRPEVLIQVNCSQEPQKYGAPVGAAVHLAEQFCSMPNLRLTGMMTMAPLTKDKKVVHDCFSRAREIFEEIGSKSFCGSEFRHLSMGMSQDYEIAIEHGATMLRIGSAIFSKLPAE
jgi:hypothetical protein